MRLRNERSWLVLLAMTMWGCGEEPMTAPSPTSPGSYACFIGRYSCIQYDLTNPDTISNRAFSCMSNEGNRWQMTACPVVGNMGRCFSNDASGSSVVVVYSASEKNLNLIRSTCTRGGGMWVPP